jgi:hypothetical protein
MFPSSFSLSLSLSLKCSINETHVKNPSKKEEKKCIFTFKTTFFLNKWRRPASATIALIHMFHEMHEEILMPEMSIIVNLHAKVGSLVHELCRPGMMVKAIIFATTLDQTKSQILAMNAATFAVDFFPFSRLVVGLSPGTFRIHTQLVVNLRVDLARILKVKHQIQSVPRPKVWIIPAIEVITFQRSQSQEITNHAINALKDAHGILL